MRARILVDPWIPRFAVGFLDTQSQPPMAHPEKKPVERGRGARQGPHALATSQRVITEQGAHCPIPRSFPAALREIGLDHDFGVVILRDVPVTPTRPTGGYVGFIWLICILACALLWWVYVARWAGIGLFRVPDVVRILPTRVIRTPTLQH